MCLRCLLPVALAATGGATTAEPEIFPVESPEPNWLRPAPIGAGITWTGCAGFVLEFGGHRICFDPFVSNPGLARVIAGPPRSDTELVRRIFGTVDAAFIGHTHYDHAMDVVALANGNPDTIVYGSRTTAELCRRQGLSSRQLQAVHDGFRTTVGPFTIEAVGAQHGKVPIVGRFDPIELTGRGVPRSPLRWPRGDVYAYRVTFGGLALHIHTSAGITEAPLARQEPVDVLIACLAARADTPRYFERLGAVLRPKVLIPCHHDNFLVPVRSRPRAVPQLRWPEFLDDVENLHQAHGTRLVRLPRGVPSEF